MPPSQDDILDRALLVETHQDTLSQIQVDAFPKQKLAFWRASNHDVDVATTRLLATEKWRRDIGIDEMMKDPTWLKKEQENRSLLQYDFFGPDQHGRPILIERVGAWDTARILEATSNEDDFLKVHCMACETLLTMDRPPSTLDDRGQVVIMDCAGLSWSHVDTSLAKAFGKLAKNDAEHYPDTLAHIWVVNAPSLFKALSVLIQPFMDSDTLSKVHVSTGVPKELAECVGEECLPQELGGTLSHVFPYDSSASLSQHPILK